MLTLVCQAEVAERLGALPGSARCVVAEAARIGLIPSPTRLYMVPGVEPTIEEMTNFLHALTAHKMTECANRGVPEEGMLVMRNSCIVAFGKASELATLLLNERDGRSKIDIMLDPRRCTIPDLTDAVFYPEPTPEVCALLATLWSGLDTDTTLGQDALRKIGATAAYGGCLFFAHRGHVFRIQDNAILSEEDVQDEMRVTLEWIIRVGVSTTLQQREAEVLAKFTRTTEVKPSGIAKSTRKWWRRSGGDICLDRLRDVLSSVVQAKPKALTDYPLFPHCEQCSSADGVPYCVMYPYHAAAMMGELTLLRKAAAKKMPQWNTEYDSRGSTVLHCAVFKGNEKVVSWLLSIGVDPDVVTKSTDAVFGGEGVTSLYMASCLHDFCRPKLIELLLEHGANPNHPSARDAAHEVTCLHNAACFGEFAAVRALLKHGANAEAITSTGETVAMCASRGMQYGCSRHGDLSIWPGMGLFRHGHARVLSLLKKHSKVNGAGGCR